MNKIGVIQIIDSLNTGGAEVLAVNIANALREREINSHLSATREEGLLKKNINENVGYLYLNRTKVIDIKSIIKFNKYIKNNDINIIHAHSTSSFFAFLVKLITPKTKVIWHDHFGKSKELDGRKLFPIKIISYFFDSIISVNSDLKKWAEDKLLCKKVYFLNNFPFFNNLDKKTVLKGESGKRIVHLAGFREQKDHQNLINAFEVFQKKNEDWSLHLIGKMYDNKYTKEILTLIKTKRLENHIFVYGACLDIFNILNQATIGVLSSKSEGLPIALLEYGLAKLPVIVTNVGECSSVVENDMSGFVIEANNYLEFSKSLNILANSEKIRESFGNTHFNNVIHKYSKENFINKLLKIYSD